jgi:hypothetical protein
MGISEVMVWFPPQGTLSPDVEAFRILASIRYSGTEGSILVTTTRPSEAAAERTLLIGHRIDLPDGTPAWSQQGLPHQGKSNVVVFHHEGLLVSVIGDLSVQELAQLAAEVRQRRSLLHGAQRGDEAARETHPADREVLHGALRLRAVQGVGRDPDLAHGVVFDAVLLVSHT